MHTRFIAAFAFAAALVSTGASAAAGYTDAYDFCPHKNCADGANPWGPPVSDGAGNWFGNTTAGGDNKQGTIYELSQSGKHWTYTPLYSFCAEKKCADGALAQGSLIIDTSGNLYGAAANGGHNNSGVIYELVKSGGSWTYKVLYTFCRHAGCPDGGEPYDVTLTYAGAASGLAYDGTSTLYGTTYLGGAANGVVFSLKPSGGSWKETVLHVFCRKTNCTDGGSPNNGVMVDGSGNLFGALAGGGKYGYGALYELQPDGTYTILHSFCAAQNTFCSDGLEPTGVPVADGQGNLYGITHMGGANNAGTAFELVRTGAKPKLVTLHTFCSETNCPDGQLPFATLAMDAAGDLLGTTVFGGDTDQGTIFKLSGTAHKTFDVVLSFGDAATPGGFSSGGLAPDSSGAFFGNTDQGGANSQGVFYKLTP